MTYLVESNYQAYIFHLVYPLSWPYLTCALLLTLITITVEKGLSVVIALFVMLFSAIIWASFHSALSAGLNCLLNSPPQTYAFTSLPLQSSLYSSLLKKLCFATKKPLSFFSNLPRVYVFASLLIRSSINLTGILKRITLSRVISTTVTIVLVASLRYLYFGGLIANPLDLTESIYWAWCGGMFKLILEGVLSEHFIKMGASRGDITIDDMLKKLIKPIKAGYTTLAMENKDEHNPSAEGSSIHNDSASTNDALMHKKKLLSDMVKRGEISKETYVDRKYALTHVALEEVANRAAANKLDAVTRMMLSLEQIRMVERYSPTAPERQILLSHFLTNYPDSRDWTHSAEDILNASKSASSTQIDNTSKDEKKRELIEEMSGKSEEPESELPK